MNPGDFRQIWLCDFEFRQPDGERPQPICMVARDLHSGQLVRHFGNELTGLSQAPVDTGSDSLVVAYYASAELGCFLALGWPLPANVLDLYAEFRVRTNGRPLPAGNGLLGALTAFGLDPMDAAEKEEMRALAIRGGPYTAEEQQALLDYCQSDVDSLVRLWSRMSPALDFPRALIRGRYMAAAARMEATGVPIDAHTWDRIRGNWDDVRGRLIAEIDQRYGVYEGITFKRDRFEAWLEAYGIPWPRLESGSLDLSDDCFRLMAKQDGRVAPLQELRHTIGQMRRIELPVGSDGRNRCMISAFRAKTGRNAPSNSKFAFGPSAWLRSLIKPGPGRAIAYIDYEQQEFQIAAVLSGDTAMMEAYRSGDPYLAFAIQAGAAPPDATKASHADVRERFKACALGVQYGMGPATLANRIGQSVAHARELLEKHKRTYPNYWAWSAGAVNTALTQGRLWTVFGWQIHVGDGANDRSLANFPSQANGAEMLRLACILLTEAGIEVCAPVHDAVLIEADVDEIDEVVARARSLMAEASRIVLGGAEVRTEAKIIRHPDRYESERGAVMWETVMGLLPSEAGVPG